MRLLKKGPKFTKINTKVTRKINCAKIDIVLKNDFVTFILAG